MKAHYEMVVKVNVYCDIQDVNDEIKTSQEMATDICNVICDEAAICGNVATYDIIRATITRG